VDALARKGSQPRRGGMPRREATVCEKDSEAKETLVRKANT